MDIKQAIEEVVKEVIQYHLTALEVAGHEVTVQLYKDKVFFDDTEHIMTERLTMLFNEKLCEMTKDIEEHRMSLEKQVSELELKKDSLYKRCMELEEREFALKNQGTPIEPAPTNHSNIELLMDERNFLRGAVITALGGKANDLY